MKNLSVDELTYIRQIALENAILHMKNSEGVPVWKSANDVVNVAKVFEDYLIRSSNE